MSYTRFAVLLSVLAVVAGAGVGSAIGELHRNATTPPPLRAAPVRTYRTTRIRTFRVSRRLEAPTALQRLAVFGHGGTAVIEWYTGSWSALAPTATESVGLYVDGRQVADTVARAEGGEYAARSAILRWVGRLTPGRHAIWARLEQATGGVALPLVVTGAAVQESLNVTEYVR